MLRNHFLSINFNRKIKFINCAQAKLLEYVNSKMNFILITNSAFRIPNSEIK
jgi:hypothetical protein